MREFLLSAMVVIGLSTAMFGGLSFGTPVDAIAANACEKAKAKCRQPCKSKWTGQGAGLVQNCIRQCAKKAGACKG